MYLLVLIIFVKYCIPNILCGHSKIIIIFQQYYFNILKYFGNFMIFPRNISKILFKYFGAVRVESPFIFQFEMSVIIKFYCSKF